MTKKPFYINLSERKLLLRAFDVFTIILSVSLASKFLDFIYININNTLIYSWFFILILYYLLFGHIFQIYNLKVSNNRFLVFRGIVLTSLVTTLFYVFSPFVTPSLPDNRLQILYFFLLITIPIIVWRFLYIGILFSPKYFKTIIILGHSSREKMIKAFSKFKNFHNIAANVCNEELDGINNFYDIDTVNLVDLVDASFTTEIIISTAGFSKETIRKINKQLVVLFEKGVVIQSFEAYYESVTKRIPKEYLDYNFYKQIDFAKNKDNQFYYFSRRAMDIIISIIGLTFLILLIPIILVCNLIANRGPLFYIQDRVGSKGKIFKIFKFRTMIKDAEKDGAVWAQKDDNRVTSFGKILRNTRIDEFPQFINVLKGEMSLVGPRPERPEFFTDLEDKIPFYAMRHIVRPGLTGWAQVNFPYANTIEEQEIKLRYDLYYIKERNTFLDFKILISTISTMLFFKGQ